MIRFVRESDLIFDEKACIKKLIDVGYHARTLGTVSYIYKTFIEPENNLSKSYKTYLEDIMYNDINVILENYSIIIDECGTISKSNINFIIEDLNKLKIANYSDMLDVSNDILMTVRSTIESLFNIMYNE